MDIGYAYQLQKLALHNRNQMEAIAFLSRPAVQQSLELLFERGTASTLEVERRHAQARRWEAAKLTHVGNASRKFILQRYLRERLAESQAIARAEEAWRRSKHCHTHNLVWAQQPEARPAGSRFGAVQADPPTAKAAPTEEMRVEAAAMKAASKASLDALLAKGGMPITRFQWRLWMADHGSEFRELMRTEPQARKDRSHRLKARGDLPTLVDRLRPQTTSYRPAARWAQVLWLRDGWHLIRSTSGTRLVFLYHLRGDTMVLSMAVLQRAPSTFKVPTKFAFLSHLKDFSVLEVEHPQQSVLGVYEALVEGHADPEGVLLTVSRARELKKPLEKPPRPPREEAVDSDDESELDKAEMSSEESCFSADTDADSVPSSFSDVAEDEPAGDQEAGADPEPEAEHDGGGGVVRATRPPLWSDGVFSYISNEGNPDAKVRLRAIWTTEAHLGHRDMSKTLTPTSFGETRQNPARSMALLRAWALWRARRGGWSTSRPGRARHFELFAEALEREVRSLPGLLLGHPAADARLREWAPDIAERIAGH